MTKRVLITGAPGQMAHYCAQILNDQGHEVTLTYHSSPDIDVSPEVHQVQLDITDTEAVGSLIASQQYDEIYNFAAMSNPRQCSILPLDAIQVNVLGISNILESVHRHCEHDPTVVQAVSEYQLNCSSLYGLTKSMSTDITMYYREKHLINAYCVILPHCESPRRGRDFFIGKLLRWMKGLKSIIDDADIREAQFEFSTDEILVIHQNEIVWRYPKIKLGNLYKKLSWVTAPDAISMIMHYVNEVDRSPVFTLDRGLYYDCAQIMEAIMIGAGFKLDWSNYYVFDRSIDTQNKPVSLDFEPESLDVEGNLDSFVSFLLSE